MRNNFKRTLAVIASAAVMGNALLAAMPVSVFAEEAGGIVGNSNSSEISNVSDQGQNEGYAGGIVGNDDALLINNGNYAVQDSDSSVPYVVSNVETDASTNSSNWVCLNLKVTQTSVIIEEIDGDSRTTHTVEGNFGSLTMLELKNIIADISGIEAEKLLLNYNGVVIYDDSFDDYEFSETSYYNIYYQQGYCNNVANLENGSVSVDKPLAAEGDVITLTALPDKGYVFDGWKVTAGGEGATITVVNNQFNMPAKDVYYSATFVECEHTGGKATCMNGMICDTCETEYNQTLDPDNHVSNTYTNGFRDCCGEYQPATDTDGNGVYEIANAGQLYWFMEHVNAGNTETDAILTTDITVNENVLNEDGTLAEGDFRDWFPIGYCYDCDGDVNKENIYYNGTFDGQGHTISGLYFDNAEQDCVGLFGQTKSGAEICNVTVEDSYFKGKNHVGGVCGYNYSSTITDCTNSGSVTGSSDYVGGVCSFNAYGTITGSTNSGSVNGSNYVGGVCGHNSSTSTITNCLNSGSVTGDSSVGGVCGYNSSTGTIKNCYYDSNIFTGNAVSLNEGTTTDVLGKTTAEFQSGEVAYLLQSAQTETDEEGNILHIWGQTLGEDTYPVLGGDKVYQCESECVGTFYSNTENETKSHFYDDNGFCTDCTDGYQPATDTDGNGVYEIANGGQLYWFMEYVNAGNAATDTILTANITVNENVLNDDGMLNGDGSDFRSWFPIGYCYDCDDDGNKENIYYNGTFDGQGHTISGLYLNNAKQSNVGLFGQIDSDAEICNVTLSDIYFSADDFVSGVCGENEGTVTNCRITGLVNGGEMVGGICGVNLNKITNCINGGSVEGEMYVSGVCGYNQGVSITDCGSTGDVNGTENVGGVCGYNTNDSIARCYNTGDVNGTENVGGVCGYNYYSAITNCINSGNVEGEKSVGGLCGYNYQAEFTNCYSIGNVHGTEYIGGVCGYKYNGEITDCYYNSDIFAGNAFGYLYTDGFGTIDDDFGRITECFKKGEIAHLLQSAQTETDEEGNILHIWGQTLGEDTYPVLGGDKVYRIENCQNVVLYSNTYGKSGHVYINGKCDVCGGLCSHESYTNGICDECEAVCSHESYTNGECDECDLVCSHESYTNGECDECDIVCEHNYYDEEKGYIINDYYASDHVIACHICGFEKTEEHIYDGGNCITCGFDELSSGADFICKEDLEFDEYESKGSLETDGYEWNHETKTLTLGNIHVNGDIVLPYYAADENESLANTIVISGSSTAVITGNICGSPYDQSLTIKSSDPANKGTIKTGISNSNVGHNDILTIKDVNLITESLMWMTNGGIAVEGAEFKVSEYCFIEAITIDEASTFELGTEIGGYGNVENGLSDIAHHLPKGYTLVTDGELTYVADSNGVRVEETVVFDGSTVTPCVDDNNDGICDSCGGYSDGIGAKLAGYTISLNGNIGVNFYMTLDKTIRNDENAYMLFTLPNGNTKKILVSEAEQNTELVYGKTYYVFSCEVSSKEMTDEIKAQITDGNGKSGTEYTYTVREYAEYIINNADSYTEDDVAFVKSMLNYGAASQNFFKNNTDDLANKNLSAEEQVIAELEAADLDEYISYAVSNEIGTFAGYSLVLESETVLKAYFKPTEGIDMNNITFTINGNDAEAVKSGDYYVLSAENIKAWDLDTMYVFRAVCGETELEFKASVMSYAYSVLNAGDVYSAELRQLVCALREYQQKSEVYISANSIDS